MAATESNPIILYDIKSTLKLEERTWSPATWKARLVLNYKRLPYKTVWLSYPEIAPALTALGLEPLETTRPGYTLPIIVDPSPAGSDAPPTIVRDSAAIAQYLDATYPDVERPLFPGGSHALQAMFLHHVTTRVIPGIVVLVVPLTPAILDGPGAEYFNRTRKEWFGKPLAEVRPTGAELEEQWAKAKAEFDVLDSILRNNDVEQGGVGGDLILGNKYSFADFVLFGIFLWVSKVRADEDGCPWDRIRTWHDGRWERLWKRCEEFTQVK